MIEPVPHIRASAPYALADLGGPNTISLAQNESAFPPSPLAIAAGREAIDHTPLYPDPDWTDLRAAIGAVHELPVDTILCGAGSMELIGCLVRAYAGPGDTVVGTQYGYAFVATACQQAGATYMRASEPTMTVSVDEILNTLTASGMGLKRAGHLASHAAARIVAQLGARLERRFTAGEIDQLLE